MVSINLAAYVRAADHDSEFVEACEETAAVMVDRLIGDNPSTKVNPSTRAMAILATGANLFQRRLTVTDLTGYANGLPQPVAARPTVDPLHAARNILGIETGPGIA